MSRLTSLEKVHVNFVNIGARFDVKSVNIGARFDANSVNIGARFDGNSVDIDGGVCRSGKIGVFESSLAVLFSVLIFKMA